MPGDLADIRRWTIQEVSAHLARGDSLYFLDVRRHPDCTQIKGASYWPPFDLLKADQIVLPFPKEALIIPYCDEPHEQLSAQIARKLLGLGYVHVYPLLGGYTTWRRRRIGYPIERRPVGRSRETFSESLN